MNTLLHDFDRPAHALVAGAAGGIGLALAHALATHPQVERLFLAARAPRREALHALERAHPGRVVVLEADITSEADLDRLREAVRRTVTSLHLVVNATGLLHEKGRHEKELRDQGLHPEKTVAKVTLANLQRSFAVNAFGPILLARALLPLLRHGDPAVFASLSARVGSIGDNRLGGWYGYRAAKAAQNQLLKTLAIELARLNPRAIVLALHPGTTDTPLSAPFRSNVPPGRLFAPADAAARLLDVIAARTPADSGGFFAWDGSVVPW